MFQRILYRWTAFLPVRVLSSDWSDWIRADVEGRTFWLKEAPILAVYLAISGLALCLTPLLGLGGVVRIVVIAGILIPYILGSSVLFRHEHIRTAVKVRQRLDPPPNGSNHFGLSPRERRLLLWSSAVAILAAFAGSLASSGGW